MSEPLAVVLIVLVLLVVVGGTIGGLWLAEQRRKELRAFATAHHLQFADEDGRWTQVWQGGPFSRGDRHRAQNVMTGSLAGRACALFDFSYQTHSTNSDGTRSNHTHRYGVVALRLGADLPRLECGDEGILGGRVAAALGFSDVQTEWGEFNQRFRVKADDPRYGLAMMHQRQMAYLMDRRVELWWIESGWIVSAVDGRQDPGAAVQRLQRLAGVVALIPSFVWRDYGHVDPARLPGRPVDPVDPLDPVDPVDPRSDRPPSY